MQYNSGYHLATEILEKLSGKELESCLLGLKYAGNGQEYCQNGDFITGREFLEKAQAIFRKIPRAKPLLGVCLSDLADVSVNLNLPDIAAGYASEAIGLLKDVPGASKGSAYITLGYVNYAKGNANDGWKYFNEAHKIALDMPDKPAFLHMLKTVREKAVRLHEQNLLRPGYSTPFRSGYKPQPSLMAGAPHADVSFAISLLIFIALFGSIAYFITTFIKPDAFVRERATYTLSGIALCLALVRTSIKRPAYEFIDEDILKRWRGIYLVVIFALLSCSIILFFM